MGQTINIAAEFSKYPAGRYRSDGPWNGQKFREDLLLPALKQGPVTVILDGVAGLPSSFLEEVVGGLVRDGFSADELSNKLFFEARTSRMAGYPGLARKYIMDAEQKLPGLKE